jgi:hypothetical protein
MSDPYLQAIRAIPAGETRTFLEVAFAAGRPGGARTASKVVNACARTDSGPWHRVVYTSGGLSHDSERAKIQWQRLQQDGARPQRNETISQWSSRVGAACIGHLQRRVFLPSGDVRTSTWPASKVEAFRTETDARSRFFRHADEPTPPNPTALPELTDVQVDMANFRAHLASLPLESARETLRSQGWVRIPGALRKRDCDALLSAARPDAFVKTNHMTPRGLGRGAYHVWAEPIPEPANSLRLALYERLACCAEPHFSDLPATLAAFHERCKAKGQTRPSSILLSYGNDGVNYLHQDRYGPVFAPYQAVVLLSQRGLDYEGGAFEWVEEPARRPKRPSRIPADQGDVILFAGEKVRREDEWVPVRHGMTPITAGHRWALGLVFHLAK